MGLKVLFAFLSVIVGITMAGYHIGGVAVGHEYGSAYAPAGALAMFYLALFAGIAMTVAGCWLAVSKRNDTWVTLTHMIVTALGMIFQIVAIALIQDTMSREGGFAMIILIVACAVIVTLANVYLIQNMRRRDQ